MAKEQGTDNVQDLDLNLDFLDNIGQEQVQGDEQDNQDEQNESGENLSQEDRELLNQQDEQSEEGSEEGSQQEESDEQNIASEEGSQEEGEGTEESEEQSSEGGYKKEAEYSTDDTLRLYAEVFKEKGLLPSSFDLDEIEGDTQEELIENQVNAIHEALESEKGSYKQNLDQLSKEVNELVEQGVDYGEAKQRVTDRARIERMTEDQLEEDDQMKEYVLRTLYKKKNYSDKDIEKMIERSKDADKLDEDAKEAKSELPEIYKQEDKQLAEQQKAQQEQREKQRQETIKKIDETLKESQGQELFPGLQMNETDANKVKEYMTQPVDWEQREDGTQVPISKEVQLRRENPIEFSKRLNYLIHLGYFDPKADMSKIGKKQESNAVKKISQRLKEQDKKSQKDTGRSKAKGADKRTNPQGWDKSQLPSWLQNMK